MTGQIDQLERETEQARTALAASLDALRDRLTPDEVVEEALDYARETRVGQVALAAREVGGPAGDPISRSMQLTRGRPIQHAPIVLPNGAIALARGLFQELPVENRNAPALIMDGAGGLQGARRDGHSRTADGKHHRDEFLG